MYVKALKRRGKKDNAKMSRRFSMSGNSCLKFFYHMYGKHTGTLTVTAGGRKVFKESRDQGNRWNEANVRLPGSGPTIEVHFHPIETEVT